MLAIFNRRLGEHIRMLFPDCTVLSGTAMSAPSFVAAALGEPAPAMSACSAARSTWPGPPMWRRAR